MENIILLYYYITYILLSGINIQPNFILLPLGERNQNLCFGKYMFKNDHEDSNWSYDTMDDWDNLCLEGDNQSPVDLPRIGM